MSLWLACWPRRRLGRQDEEEGPRRDRQPRRRQGRQPLLAGEGDRARQAAGAGGRAGAKIVDDPVIAEYVNRLGQNLVRNSDAKVPFTIKVIDQRRGQRLRPARRLLLRQLRADHEGRDARRNWPASWRTRSRTWRRGTARGRPPAAPSPTTLTIPLIFMGGWAGYAIRQGASLAIPLGFLTLLPRLRVGSRPARACSTCTRPATTRPRSWTSSRRSRRSKRRSRAPCPRSSRRTP